MKFPDPNIGYVFGYKSTIVDDEILITFLGGRISWDVIRWGKCPPKTEALKVILLPGHKSSKTTEIYTHVTNKDIGRIKSPLDSMIKDLHLEDGVEMHEENKILSPVGFS